jgi:hypothetical protein
MGLKAMRLDGNILARSVLGALFLSFLLVVVEWPATASSDADLTEKNIVIKKDGFYNKVLTGFPKNDEIEVQVVASAPIDLYILSLAQHNAYYINRTDQTFVPLKSKLNARTPNIHFIVPDYQAYVVVIDNDYREKKGEAVPSQNVTVELRIGASTPRKEDAFWGIWISLSFIGVIFIITASAIILMTRQKRTVSSLSNDQPVPLEPRPKPRPEVQAVSQAPAKASPPQQPQNPEPPLSIKWDRPS